MRIATFLVLIIGMSFLSTGLQAQSKTTNTKTTTIKKIKPPKLKTSLAQFSDSAGVMLTEVSKILAYPLRVSDDKKANYTITNYHLMYKRKVMTEDETTGKTSPTTVMVSEDFTKSPLPELWVNTIRGQLKTGEELYFFDIIVKDADGRVMYAPNLKIIVQ